MAYKGFKRMTREELMEKYSLTEKDKYLLDELEAVEDEVEKAVRKEEN